MLYLIEDNASGKVVLLSKDGPKVNLHLTEIDYDSPHFDHFIDYLIKYRGFTYAKIVNYTTTMMRG